MARGWRRHSRHARQRHLLAAHRHEPQSRCSMRPVIAAAASRAIGVLPVNSASTSQMPTADLTVKAPNGFVGFVELWRFAPDGQIDSVPEAFSERFVGI